MRKWRLSAGACFLLALSAAIWATAAQAAEETAPKAVFIESSWAFEPVLEGQEVIHDFVVKNQGTAPLEILEVKAS